MRERFFILYSKQVTVVCCVLIEDLLCKIHFYIVFTSTVCVHNHPKIVKIYPLLFFKSP